MCVIQNLTSEKVLNRKHTRRAPTRISISRPCRGQEAESSSEARNSQHAGLLAGVSCRRRIAVTPFEPSLGDLNAA